MDPDQDDEDQGTFDGKPQPIVRKHYTSFNGIHQMLNNLHNNPSGMGSCPRKRLILQPHLNYLR